MESGFNDVTSIVDEVELEVKTKDDDADDDADVDVDAVDAVDTLEIVETDR